MSISLWAGILQLGIYRSSEPRKALVVFYDILDYLATAKGFDEMCSDFNIDTARSMVAYNRCSAKSSASGNISSALRSSLRGNTPLDEQEQDRILSTITRDDVKRVYEKYFLKFLDERYLGSC